MPPVEGAPTRDLYTRSRVSHAAPIDIQKVKLAQWTIEASVKAKVVNVGTQTFVGRDGGDGAVMSFSIDPQDHFEMFFRDKHHSHRAVAKSACARNQWYHLAAVSDGNFLRLYVDELDGRGYRLCRTTYLYPEHGATVLAPTNPNAEWSVGRGRMNRVTCEWPGLDRRSADMRRGAAAGRVPFCFPQCGGAACPRGRQRDGGRQLDRGGCGAGRQCRFIGASGGKTRLQCKNVRGIAVIGIETMNWKESLDCQNVLTD